MSFLTKEQSINRDAAGNLLSEVITVEFWPDDKDDEGNIKPKPDIKYMPVNKGQFNEIFGKTKGGKTDRDLDQTILEDHCILPKFSAEEMKLMSIGKITAIVIAIFAGSTGKTQSETKELMDVGIKKLTEVQSELKEKKD